MLYLLRFTSVSLTSTLPIFQVVHPVPVRADTRGGGRHEMAVHIFGFVARKTPGQSDNACHVFCETDPDQPASAIVNFVTKVLMGSNHRSPAPSQHLRWRSIDRSINQSIKQSIKLKQSFNKLFNYWWILLQYLSFTAYTMTTESRVVGVDVFCAIRWKVNPARSKPARPPYHYTSSNDAGPCQIGHGRWWRWMIPCPSQSHRPSSKFFNINQY